MSEDAAWRSYIADILKASAEGKTIAQTWDELLRTPRDFDADAVMDDVIRRMGLAVDL